MSEFLRDYLTVVWFGAIALVLGGGLAFLQRGVPSLFVHTGLHPDYHTQYDRPEKIDYAKMERVTRLAYWVAYQAADAKERPKQLGKQPGW